MSNIYMEQGNMSIPNLMWLDLDKMSAKSHKYPIT